MTGGNEGRSDYGEMQTEVFSFEFLFHEEGVQEASVWPTPRFIPSPVCTVNHKL
jgi:hypothetical protein